MIIGKMRCILYWVAIFWQSKSGSELKVCLLSKQNVSPRAVCLILQETAETTLKNPCVQGKGWDSITVLQALKNPLCARFGAIYGLLLKKKKKNPVFCRSNEIHLIWWKVLDNIPAVAACGCFLTGVWESQHHLIRAHFKLTCNCLHRKGKKWVPLQLWDSVLHIQLEYDIAALACRPVGFK